MPKTPPHKALDTRRAEIYAGYKKDSFREKFIVSMQMLQAERYDEDEGALRVALGSWMTARARLMAERVKNIRASGRKTRAEEALEEETKCEAQILSKIESQVDACGRLAERRSKVLGLLTDKLMLSDPSGKNPFETLSDGELLKQATTIAAIIQRGVNAAT